jgi:hypothetical protein
MIVETLKKFWVESKIFILIEKQNKNTMMFYII